MESYCIGKDCDCRKVILNIISKETGEPLASIGYGWEPFKFYRKWAHGSSQLAKQITGFHFELDGYQAEFSQAFMRMLKRLVKMNKRFPERFKEHYRMFKELVNSTKSDGPCLCTSGNAYGECCGEERI